LTVPVIKDSEKDIFLSDITDFEDQAHQNFQLGAWYGSELAGKMVPVTNPMAKLCGEIVSNAMKQEIEGYRG